MAASLTLDRSAMKDRNTSYLRVYVGGLTEQATQDNVYEHFAPYGKITGIAINRGFGFVQFEEESCAQEAISKANGSGFLGKTIVVKTAQSNADKAKRDEEHSLQQDTQPSSVIKNDIVPDESAEDLPYDNYGNFVGDGASGGYQGDNSGYRDAEPGGFGGHRDGGTWDDSWGGGRGRGGLRGRGRGAPRGRGGFRERSPLGRAADWGERSYERYQPPPAEYPRALPVPERNDCEIIVVSKALTEYAEFIEGRLKRLGIVVDLLFPMEDVPIGKVLGNIASRGCLYAILVMPQNQEHRSLTLNILHGLPQEHRNMPLEDALQLLSHNFQELQRGGGAVGREAVYALLGQLADGRTLTALQYEKVIKYLQERRDHQVKVELGEPLDSTSSKTQVDLQQRIMSILNDPKPKAPEPILAPVGKPSQAKLLNDPTVRKALDSILQKFT